MFKVAEPNDWTLLARQRVEAVLDPIVLRTAHLFLLGPGATQHPAEAWRILSANIGALATFIDSLVLRERIPVFNYGMTYDTHPPPEGAMVVWRAEPAELLDVCGDSLIAVHLSYKTDIMKGEYFILQERASMQLRDAPPLPTECADALVNQLTAYGFRWKPLGITPQGEENALHPSATPYDGLQGDNGPAQDVETRAQDVAKIVRDYLAGCWLFSGYAQRLGGEHVLPPEWSRVYAMVALRPATYEKLAEDALFRRLAEVGNADHLGIGRTVTFDQPTFLPYLADRADVRTPADLFRAAADMHGHSAVQQYIAKRAEVRDVAKNQGKATAFEREINELAAAAQRAAQSRTSAREWKINMQGSLSFPLGAGVQVAKDADLFPAAEWSMRHVPGNGYRKLLLRLIDAQDQLDNLSGRLQNIWNAG